MDESIHSQLSEEDFTAGMWLLLDTSVSRDASDWTVKMSPKRGMLEEKTEVRSTSVSPIRNSDICTAGEMTPLQQNGLKPKVKMLECWASA